VYGRDIRVGEFKCAIYIFQQRVLLCQSNLGKISPNYDKLCHNFGPMHTTFGQYVFGY